MSAFRKLGSSAMPLLHQSATCARAGAAAAVPKRVAVSVPFSRSFSILPSLRPTTLQTSARSSVFRTNTMPTTAAIAPSSGNGLDLVPKTAISAHPALAGWGSQIRCGPRPTMANASRLIQKRRHGFLSRIRTAKGRKILAARKAKGRRRLSA